MECRGCGRNVDDANVRMVAKWPFCPDCFEDLLAKKGAAPAPVNAPAQETEEDETPPERAAPATTPCQICKRPTVEALMKKVGIWRFCPDCYADLASPAHEDASADMQAAPEAALKKPDDKPDDKNDAASGGPAGDRIESARFVNCNRCGRRIPEAGSKALDGASLCPDCYYAGAREVSSQLLKI